jgi:hypothetical protein
MDGACVLAPGRSGIARNILGRITTANTVATCLIGAQISATEVRARGLLVRGHAEGTRKPIVRAD